MVVVLLEFLGFSSSSIKRDNAMHFLCVIWKYIFIVWRTLKLFKIPHLKKLVVERVSFFIISFLLFFLINPKCFIIIIIATAIATHTTRRTLTPSRSGFFVVIVFLHARSLVRYFLKQRLVGEKYYNNKLNIYILKTKKIFSKSHMKQQQQNRRVTNIVIVIKLFLK